MVYIKEILIVPTVRRRYSELTPNLIKTTQEQSKYTYNDNLSLNMLSY